MLDTENRDADRDNALAELSSEIEALNSLWNEMNFLTQSTPTSDIRKTTALVKAYNAQIRAVLQLHFPHADIR